MKFLRPLAVLIADFTTIAQAMSVDQPDPPTDVQQLLETIHETYGFPAATVDGVARELIALGREGPFGPAALVSFVFDAPPLFEAEALCRTSSDKPNQIGRNLQGTVWILKDIVMAEIQVVERDV